jgi:hypothetical protein
MSEGTYHAPVLGHCVQKPLRHERPWLEQSVHAAPLVPHAWSDWPGVHDPAEQQPVVQPVHPAAPLVQPWLAQPWPVCVQSMQTRPPLPQAVLDVPPTHAPFEQQPVAQLTESHPASPPELEPDPEPEPELEPEPDPELDPEPELDPDPDPRSVAPAPPASSSGESPLPLVAQPASARRLAATAPSVRAFIYWLGGMTTVLIGCTAAPAGYA